MLCAVRLTLRRITRRVLRINIRLRDKHRPPPEFVPTAQISKFQFSIAKLGRESLLRIDAASSSLKPVVEMQGRTGAANVECTNFTDLRPNTCHRFPGHKRQRRRIERFLSCAPFFVPSALLEAYETRDANRSLDHESWVSPELDMNS